MNNLQRPLCGVTRQKINTAMEVDDEACPSKLPRLQTQMSDAKTSASSSLTTTSVSPVQTRAITRELITTSPAKTINNTSARLAPPPNITALQSLGEPDPSQITKTDLLSAMTFDKTGKYLSVGDRGGRVIIFEQGQDDFDYLTEIQAFEKEIDVLSSREISTTVTALEWVNPSRAQKPAFLVANSKAIKLYRLEPKRKVKTESIQKLVAKGGMIRIPRTRVCEEVIEPKLITTFKSGNDNHLHSASLMEDGELFLTADNSKINLWNLYREGADVQNLVDLGKTKSSNFDEVVKFAKFDTQSQSFLYTTSSGKINICDLRESSSF